MKNQLDVITIVETLIVKDTKSIFDIQIPIQTINEASNILSIDSVTGDITFLKIKDKEQFLKSNNLL